MNNTKRILFSIETGDEWILRAYKAFFDSLAGNNQYEIFCTVSGSSEKDELLRIYNVIDYEKISHNSLNLLAHGLLLKPAQELIEQAQKYSLWASYERLLERFARFKVALNLIQPDGVIVWNGMADIRGMIKVLLSKLQIPFFYAEKGMLPDSWYLDEAGINALCSLDASSLSKNVRPEEKSKIEDYIQSIIRSGSSAWKQPSRIAGEQTIKKKLGIDLDSPVIFFPGQVDEDVNITMFSPFENVAEAVSLVLESKPQKAALVVKPHPKSKEQSQKRLAELSKQHGKLTIVRDVNIWDLIEISDLVVAINSTVAFESLLKRKKVLLLGDSVISKVGLLEKVGVADLKAKLPTYLTAPFESITDYSQVLSFVKFLLDDYYIFRDYHSITEPVLLKLKSKITAISNKMFTKDELMEMFYAEKLPNPDDHKRNFSNMSAVDYFIKAGEELNRENFGTAIEYMQQYRSMIDYSRFPRILNKSRKRGEIDVSVIIVTYNRTEDLKRCLESLSKQDDATFEVIVVDNGESDFEVFQQYVDQYIKCPINFILSEGRNIGACCAKGKIVAFLDDDALVPPNYVSSIKSAFDQFDIFGLRGRTYPKSSSNANNHLNIYDLGDRPFPSYCNQEGNSAWLLEVYKSMDGMDPLLYGHEGSDLTFRIIKQYKQPNKVIYWPYAIIYHDYGTADKLRLKKRIHQRNANYLKYKHNTDIFVNRRDIEKYPLPLKQTQFLPDKVSYIPEGSTFQPTRCAKHPAKPSEVPKVKYPNNVSAASPSHLHPRVSIVISCYNCENFLPECLDSIRNQTMNNWELFLLDDASTDGTRSIIEKYAWIDERIKPYYFRDNKGPYVRRNFAIERANSDFIVIQDADDVMYHPKLEILYNEIVKDERLKVVGSFYRMCLEQSKGLEYADKVELPTTHDEIMQQYGLERYICWHGSAIIRKSMFEQIGLYDEHPYGSDKFWLAKAAEYARCNNEVRFKNVPEYLTLKREHSSSQQGLLPTLDPRSRRAGFQTYWEYKLLKIREKLYNNPSVDIQAELRNCRCDDYIIRYGCLFEQWESQPLDDNVLGWLITRGVRKFNEGKYVQCIITLDSVERILNDVTRRFNNYDLLRAMAYFAINMKQQCLRYLNREIENHNNTAARKFISDYFENQIEADVRSWYLENSKLYDLRLIDTEREIDAEQGSCIIFEQNIPSQLDEPEESRQSSCYGQTGPLVSVIMPAYNAAEFIVEAIESVLIQNYRNFELIVIDDGSTDNTRDVVASFKDDKIQYFYQENKGLAGAHNTGIKNSKGLFLIKLDSDDLMTPDFIAKHIEEFDKHPDADLVYCDDCLIDENSKSIRVIERPEYTDRRLLIRDLFRCGFPVVPFRTCIRRSVFDKIGFFDENLRMAEDYDMMRRFVKYGLKVQHLPGALYLRRMTDNSLSRNYSSQNAKFHFEVIRRFTDTFTCDELFPDVAWDQIAPEMRQLHAKCLTAGTYLAIGQEYVKTNAINYSRTAFDLTCSELNDCLKMDPDNHDLRQLLHKSELIRARYSDGSPAGRSLTKADVVSEYTINS